MKPSYTESSQSVNRKWLRKPTASHLVQFYGSSGDLLSSLSEYVIEGLRKDESCIVIATPDHVSNLRNLVNENGVDISVAEKSGQFIAYDADDTLAKFMINDLPDRQKFMYVVGGLIEDNIAKGKPIRAYGEMVALLWNDGNKEAVISLENLWNELLQRYPFSLYCAYSHLHFIMEPDVRNEIRHTHSLQLG